MGMMNPMMMGSMGSESSPPEPETTPALPRRCGCPFRANSWSGGIFVVGYPYGGMGMGMMGSKSALITPRLR
jgi:hypothetical protein